MKISYVIPCYNSHDTIELVINDINEAMSLEKIVSSDFEIICVDDGSHDQTIEVLKTISNQFNNVRYISFSKNFGQDAAILAGLKESQGEVVVTLDDDGQNSPFEVKKMLDAINNQNVDVVFAKYKEKKHSFFRNCFSKVNDFMAEKLISKPKGLYVGSFCAIRKYVVERVVQYENPYPYLRGLLLQTTSHIINVDVEHRDRILGESTYTFHSLFRLWLNGFTAFSIKPLRVSMVLGLLSSFVSIGLIIYAVGVKILTPTMEIGWASTFCAISFFGGVVLLMLGILGEYVGRTYICINHTPQYVIRESKKK